MGKPPPRIISEIQPGLFKIRLVRNGPWVAAAIQHDPACGWYALIDGVRQSEPNRTPEEAAEVERIWLFGRSIEQDEYRRLTRSDRAIDPRTPANLANLKPVF